MASVIPKQKQRQRAPSQRSLESREKILDAAERVFAWAGFDGSTMRDIAAEAGVPVGLVSHHGGGKDHLFAEVVARRAECLSLLRLSALNTARAKGSLTGEIVIRSFIEPYVEKARVGGDQWLAYARIVALVSADPKWSALSAAHFDPTAQTFIMELAKLYPKAAPSAVAECYVYAISAMLALLTSRWRIEALSGEEGGDLDGLITYCAAGLEARLA
jgi:AcrR family transcriptional regulator